MSFILNRIPLKNGVMLHIVNDVYMEGLPHTQDANTIVLPMRVYNSARREKTIVHEGVHIDQRRNPDKWYTFYKTMWDYDIRSNAPEQLRSYSVALRPNPDTEMAPWAVWKERYVFFPVYGEERKLKTAKIVVYDLQTSAFIDPPEEWKTEFCEAGNCPNQWEHPHEMAAEFITEGSKCPAAVKLLYANHRNELQ